MSRKDLMSSPESGLWSQAGETLSEKTALKEFGLSYEEIVKAIKAGKLQYRMQSVFGNPFIRLLRREVEGLVKAKKGDNFFQEKKLKNELQKNNTNLRSLKRQITVLEKRKDELLKLLKKI